MYNVLDIFYEFINFKKSYCAAASINYYNENLSKFFSWLSFNKELHLNSIDISSITKNDLINYIVYLRDATSAKNVSISTYYRAVKVFIRYCFDEGYIDLDITQRVKQLKCDKQIVLPLSQGEVNLIDIELDRRTYLSYRNYLIVHLMLDCGLRCQEVINLKYDDINFENNYITINNSKCNKSRVIPISEILQNYILEFVLVFYHNKIVDYLFCNRYQNSRLTDDCLKKLFSNLKRVVPRVHAHLLRHTFATSYIMGGGNMEYLRILLGHADYNVTKDYLHISSQYQIIGYDIYRLDSIYFKNYNNY